MKGLKIFDKSKEANLSQVKKNEKACLISKYDSHFKPDEQVYEDFISRREFINHTGVYVSASYFDIVYDKFKESGLSIGEFLESFSANPMIQEVNLSGTFKYMADDDTVNCFGTYDENHEPNIWEIINSIDMEMFHKCMEAFEGVTGMADLFKNYDKDISEKLEEIKSVVSDMDGIFEAGQDILSDLNKSICDTVCITEE